MKKAEIITDKMDEVFDRIPFTQEGFDYILNELKQSKIELNQERFYSSHLNKELSKHLERMRDSNVTALSAKDFDLIVEDIENPKCNKQLAKAMKRKLCFDLLELNDIFSK